jgi:hypothetical protein
MERINQVSFSEVAFAESLHRGIKRLLKLSVPSILSLKSWKKQKKKGNCQRIYRDKNNAAF